MFIWDSGLVAPLGKILDFARKNPGLQAFEINDGSYWFFLVFAKDRAEVARFCKDDGIKYSSIRKWKDED